jgi:DNA (cytosine-5)-methyltransferase 1
VITRELENVGYSVSHAVLNSNDFGVPQQRKRVFIAGVLGGPAPSFPVGSTCDMVVRDILEDWVDVDPKFLAENKLKSSYLNKTPDKLKLDEFRDRYRAHSEGRQPGRIVPVSIIMNDTPSGISRQHDRLYSIDGISRTLATFGHPYFDVNGTWRLLTPREFARLQGFPESFVMDENDNKSMKQFGNAVTTNVITSVVSQLVGSEGFSTEQLSHMEGF